MHQLPDLAPLFLGGQCQINTKNNEIYRGEVEQIRIQKEVVYIYFRWLYVKCATADKSNLTKVSWRQVPQSRSGEIRNDFPFRKFKLVEDNTQLMLIGWGENCLFTKSDDATNIAKPE